MALYSLEHSDIELVPIREGLLGSLNRALTQRSADPACHGGYPSQLRSARPYMPGRRACAFCKASSVILASDA